MATVFIPASLRKYTKSQQKLDVEGANIREIIEQLDNQYPGIRERLLVDNQFRPGLAVAIDSRVSSHGLLEPVEPGSEIHFVHSVSGG